MRVKDLRRKNRVDVLRLISEGARSRAEVSSTLGLSKPVVSSLVDALISEGLVVENRRGQSRAGGGKISVLLDLNPDAGWVVAVYINERWYEVAIVDLSSRVISHIKRDTRLSRDYRETFEDILKTVGACIDQARRSGTSPRILACGLAIKGLVDTNAGRLLYSGTIPYWKDVPVRDYLRAELGVPVYVENDARAITSAEMLYGEGKGTGTFACVSAGWGLATGMVIEHEVYRGAYDAAVTFAHTTVAENGPRCSCGNRGCWEAMVSNNTFLRELGRRDSDLTWIDFSSAIEKFRRGDEIVRDVLLNHTGYWLGVGISNMLNVFNPEKLVMQGSITQAGEPLREKIEAVVREKALPIPGKAEIVFSRMTNKVEVRGAAAVVIKRFLSAEDHYVLWRSGKLAGRSA